MSPGRHIWALGGVGGRQEVGLSELLDRPAPRSAGGVFSSLCESSLELLPAITEGKSLPLWPPSEGLQADATARINLLLSHSSV